MSETTTKPYFLRAIYEWCTDNGYTPYIGVKVTSTVRVPMEYVRNGEIVLNISFGATSGLKMDNEAIAFKARFSGQSRELYIPIANVMAIYASENGQGMAFDVVLNETVPTPALRGAHAALAAVPREQSEADSLEFAEDMQKKSGKPSLTLVK